MLHHDAMSQSALELPDSMPVSSGQAERIFKLQQELDDLFAARSGQNMTLTQQERVESIFNEIDEIYKGC